METEQFIETMKQHVAGFEELQKRLTLLYQMVSEIEGRLDEA